MTNCPYFLPPDQYWLYNGAKAWDPHAEGAHKGMAAVLCGLLQVRPSYPPTSSERGGPVADGGASARLVAEQGRATLPAGLSVQPLPCAGSRADPRLASRAPPPGPSLAGVGCTLRTVTGDECRKAVALGQVRRPGRRGARYREQRAHCQDPARHDRWRAPGREGQSVSHPLCVTEG